MGRKKKGKQKVYEDYDEYDSYEDEDYDDEYTDEDEYDDEIESEAEESGYSQTASSARSLGRRKKRGKLKSSFVRPDARPSRVRQTSYSTSRKTTQNQRGPHFAMNPNRMPSKYTRQETSIFAAWGKLLVLIFILALGTWLAFSLSGGNEPLQNSVKENPVPRHDFSKSEEYPEVEAPEIVQKAKNVSSNTRIIDNRLFYLTSSPFQLESKEGAKLLRQQLELLAPMSRISSGKFKMGDDFSQSNDQKPAHLVSVSSFVMDASPVTNRQFQLFVDATNHQTTAERQGWSSVFDLEKKQWIQQEGACWKDPQGDDSWNDELWDHPVTHVSYDDALAFCLWCGKKLPTEAQWEYVARGDRVDYRYPWGNELIPDGHWMGNFWQGWFPDKNTLADGFATTSPVRSYPANPFGLFDLGGNVWEWCHDWYTDSYYRLSDSDNPKGPSQGETRVIRGGSFLSAENHEAGYSVAFRSSLPPQTTRSDVGFRCVTDSAQQ